MPQCCANSLGSFSQYAYCCSFTAHLDERIKVHFSCSFLRLAGIESMIFSAFFLSSILSVRRYFGVLNLNLVVLLFLLFLMMIFAAFGKCCCSLLMILMNSFKSLISFGIIFFPKYKIIPM